jgi:O-antigen biosynthesis protein
MPGSSPRRQLFAFGPRAALNRLSRPPPPIPALAPRVSILIRSIARPTLKRALESVYRQGPPLQVLLLQAGEAALGDLPSPPPDIHVRLLQPAHPLGRAAAANHLLNHVQTQLALFLDDDDWLLDGHLQRLIDALDAHPEAPAAHAGVVCVAADAPEAAELHRYDAPAPWAEMQLSNRLPIHAVMFRMAVVDHAPGLRVAEDLLQFEDWDFWLQVMQRGGAFVHVPGISAVYGLDVSHGSGHADSATPERSLRLQAFAQRQLQRWSVADVATLMERDAQQEARLAQLQQTLQARRLQDERLTDIAALEAQARNLREQLDATARAREQLLDQLNEQAARAARVDEQLAAALQQQDVQQHEIGLLRREGDLLAALRVEHLRQIQMFSGQLAALHASTSWRLTRPMRVVAGGLRALRAGRAQALVRNVFLAVRQESQRHGWVGFVRRAPHYLRHAGRLGRVLTTHVPQAPSNPFAVTHVRSVGRPRRLHPELLPESALIDTRVSVVIPTLNAGEELRGLLNKLKAQRGVRELEIVIVDSGSTDGTPELARSLGAVVVEIAAADFSHSHARNLGAEAARGDWLLFMVQDAFPIGDRWAFGMVRYLLDHAAQGVVAASCAETSRSDSDLMYDCNIATHYRFLGCHDADRIGSYQGDDHMALRSQGQLSDVACMIPRPLFLSYRYRGDYAEDLDLGIRLIKDGHRVAMLASIKVIHSHNRPAYYYLKRSFVDVIFLVGLFEDFHCPPCESVAGLVQGASAVAAELAVWMARPPTPGADSLALAELEAWLGALASAVDARRAAALLGAARHEGAPPQPAALPLGDDRLGDSLQMLARTVPDAHANSAAEQRESRHFVASFVARVRHLAQFAGAVYGPLDDKLQRELAAAVCKSFASTLGSGLAFMYLDSRARAPGDAQRRFGDSLFTQLKAGV